MKIVSAAVDNATVTWFGAALLLLVFRTAQRVKRP